MSKLIKIIKSKPISLLLVFVPLALAADYLHWNALAVFSSAVLILGILYTAKNLKDAEG